MSVKKTCLDSEGKVICEHATKDNIGKVTCDRPNMGCISCWGGHPYDECYADRMEAEWNSPEYKAQQAKEMAKRKADDETWSNRPKIDLVCKKYGTAKELGLEEYNDKRCRRKYRGGWHCEKCQDWTDHEWRFKSCSTNEKKE